MIDWPVGLSTGCFYQRPITEVLTPVRDGGFATLEICSSPAHLDYHDRQAVGRAAGMMRDLGLDPYSFHAPFREAIDITALDAARRGSSVDELLVAADSAAQLGVRNFVIHPGPDRAGRPPEAEYAQRMRNAADGLTRVAGHCRDRGMTLVLENMLPHLLFGRTGDVLWIMGEIRDLNVGICLDCGHAHIAGDLYTAPQKIGGHLRMLHANDNFGDADSHLPPGRGGVDWTQLLGVLAAVPFRGGVILELAGGHEPDPAAFIREARASREYLQGLLRQAQPS
jgi:sugar phosphate isomerase/epimerase